MSKRGKLRKAKLFRDLSKLKENRQSFRDAYARTWKEEDGAKCRELTVRIRGVKRELQGLIYGDGF